MTDKNDLERAWMYHEAADQLLNGRIQSFLIAQAFLIVGYAQLLTAENFDEKTNLVAALFALSVLAILLTLVMRALASQLSRGIRELKEGYLLNDEHGDEVYRRYFSAVRGDGVDPTLDGFARGWTRTVPNCFLIFWLVAFTYALVILSSAIKAGVDNWFMV